MLRVLLFITLFLTITQAMFAQEYSGAAEPVLPQSARLDGLTMIHQDINRCASAALTIQLTYFDEFDGTYHGIIDRLSPYSGDVSVRIEEMAAAAEDFGLRAIVRRAGTIDLLKALVAEGFPVLIENVYYDGPNGWRDWMSHNRVLVGYDDALQELYFFDPLLGNGPDGRGRAMTYADVDERWQPFNRDYLVVYREEDEERLKVVIGRDWDLAANAENALIQADTEITLNAANSFAHFNRGWALLQLERFEESAAAFDEALRLRLPWRMLWYEFGPFEAYLAVGRYDDVIREVYNVLQTTDGVEEMYYFIAQAYAGKGDIPRAIANLELAVYRNRHFHEAAALIAEYKARSG